MGAWWDPRKWPNPLSWASDKLDSNDKAYLRNKEQMRQMAQKTQLICMAGGIIVAAFVANDLIRKKTLSVIIDVPFAYFMYNGFRVAQNFETIAENPNQYSSFFGWGAVVGNNDIDKGRVRECLIKNTFCFGYFVDFILGLLTKKN